MVRSASSVVVGREIFDWTRFHNRRQVSSYTGLCPGEYSSGGKRVPGSVTKHGNPRLRAALVELARQMEQYFPRRDFPRRKAPPWHRFEGNSKSAHRLNRAAFRFTRRICHVVLTPPRVMHG